MKLHIKIMLLSLLIVPLCAFLDAVLIRGLTFYEYLYVCIFEMFIFNIGVLVGVKSFRKELEKHTNIQFD